MISRLEEQKKAKDNQIIQEEKAWKKRDREARKLEMLEMEILKRVRDTHVK